MTIQNGQLVGYRRVSSVDQNEARQLDGVKLDRIFTDKASGGTRNRPQLDECLAYVRSGDTLVVHSIDRLARNMVDLLQIVEGLIGKGVSVRFEKENLTFKPDKADPFSKLMLQQLGAFAEFERSMIRERQREGIAMAKARGQQLGRKPSLTADQIAQARAKRLAGEPVAALAKEFGVSRAGMYRYLEGAA
jgi:DNA invertase Pin-like site-specific DNA recombinase